MSASWTEWTVRIAFAVAGVVHVLPLAGIFGRSALERGYGVSLGEGPDLVILMQHRALLFGLLACACFLAVKEPGCRFAVGLGVLVSMVGFIVIAAGQNHGAAISNVVAVDIGAALLLIVGLGLQLHQVHRAP